MIVLTDSNLLPAICGRVCPQEDQCEGVCPVGDPGAGGDREARAMARRPGDQGGLEQRPLYRAQRFSDRHRRFGARWESPARPTWPKRDAMSPSSRPFTSQAACCVTAFPEFRLPNEVIDAEIDALSGWASRSSAIPWSGACSLSSR